MKKQLNLFKCLFSLLLSVITLSTVSVYAATTYPWVITTPASDSIMIGGDEYVVKTAFKKRNEAIGCCAFRAVALYDANGVLIAISTSENTGEGEETFNLKSEKDAAYYKVFAWDNAQSMVPVAFARDYAIEEGFYYFCTKGEKLELPQNTKIKILGATISEIKGLKPDKCYLWKEDAQLLEWYANEEFFAVENNQFTTKENGKYLIYAKDEDGTQWFKWITICNVKEPEPELSFESAYYNDEQIAYLTVHLNDQNNNAEIAEMGILDYIPELLPGDYANSNVRETRYLNEAVPVKEGHVITVTEPGAYTLVAKDTWGNTGIYSIEVRDINHDRVLWDNSSSRYYTAE